MEDSLESKEGREEEMDQESEDNVLVEGLTKAENEVGNTGSAVQDQERTTSGKVDGEELDMMKNGRHLLKEGNEKSSEKVEAEEEKVEGQSSTIKETEVQKGEEGNIDNMIAGDQKKEGEKDKEEKGEKKKEGEKDKEG